MLVRVRQNAPPCHRRGKLINGSRLIGCPILSLHVGGAVANVSDIIVDPNDLKIIGFQVSGPLVRGEVGNVLPVDSVR